MVIFVVAIFPTFVSMTAAIAFMWLAADSATVNALTSSVRAGRLRGRGPTAAAVPFSPVALWAIQSFGAHAEQLYGIVFYLQNGRSSTCASSRSTGPASRAT